VLYQTLFNAYGHICIAKIFDEWQLANVHYTQGAKIVRSESHCALTIWYVVLVVKTCSDRPRTLNELKTAITEYITNISQADLQKVFANKIKRVQARIDARGHHF